MIFIKAQVATEYLVIAGLVLVIIIPLVFLYVKYTTESDYAITSAKVASIANEISKAANSVYVYGQDSQLVIEVDFPKNLDTIIIPNTPGNKDIRFVMRDNEGRLVDIVKQSEANVFAYGDLPISPGRKKIIVKSLGDRVLVQIPCTETLADTKCVGPSTYSACTGNKCLIQCQNFAWTIIETCVNPTPNCVDGGTQCTS